MIRSVLGLALRYDLRVGTLPLPAQKELMRTYALPAKLEPAIELALGSNGRPIHLVRCDETLILSKVTIGRLPLIDSTQDSSRWKMLVQEARRFKGLRLQPFQFATAGDQTIKTAACGYMVAPYRTGNIAFRMSLSRSSCCSPPI